MLPWHACWRCGSRQMMFFPGAKTVFSAQHAHHAPPGAIPRLAPVIQAEPGLNGNELTSLFGRTITEFCTGFSGQIGEDLAHALSGWMGGVQRA
jgi:hypothetical protein